MILFREQIPLDLACRLVTVLRKRARIDERDPEHAAGAGYFYQQAKDLGQAIKRARRAQPQGPEHGSHG